MHENYDIMHESNHTAARLHKIAKCSTTLKRIASPLSIINPLISISNNHIQQTNTNHQYTHEFCRQIANVALLSPEINISSRLQAHERV